jgi:hypothetical protein
MGCQDACAIDFKTGIQKPKCEMEKRFNYTSFADFLQHLATICVIFAANPTDTNSMGMEQPGFCSIFGEQF